VVDGRTLRAAALAMDEFFPEPAPLLPDDADPLSRCLARRDSYDVLVWSGGGVIKPEVDGGAADPDAGASSTSSTSQDVLFVTISSAAGPARRAIRPSSMPAGPTPLMR